MTPKNPIDIMAHAIPIYPKGSSFLNNVLQYARLFQMQVKSEYKSQGIQTIRIGVDILLAHLLLPSEKKIV